MKNKLKLPFHYLKGLLASYLVPVKKDLTLLGVTGTDGKTTTTLMTFHILNSLGFKTGYITTVGTYLGKDTKYQGLHITTPSPFDLRQMINEASNNGLTHLIIEVSSHGLAQFRVSGLDFFASALTNITPEHLDYHGDFNNYLNDKAKLFKMSRNTIINKDDPKSFTSLKLKFPKALSYSRLTDADYNLKEIPLKLNILGDYNQSNALAAIALCHSLGVNTKESAKTLSTFTAPKGRMEIVTKKPFTVIVDFAHTPNGLASCLPSINKNKGRLIHVFGSAGLRDPHKRPEMGKVSSSYADIIILTSEDPRTESVKSINNAIKKGISKEFKGKVFEIEDRKKAIEKAISIAKPNDTVIITGKGPEQSMNIKGIEHPWDEFKTVELALKNL